MDGRFERPGEHSFGELLAAGEMEKALHWYAREERSSRTMDGDDGQQLWMMSAQHSRPASSL